MKKNVAGQKIGAQLITAADGSNFTGAVTVAVTIDAGTQATGSVGSGACTHEGNGYHTYAPAQAETNGDLVAFTFIGTGAISVTVQVYTSFPQTVDNNTSIALIKTATDNLPADPADASVVAGLIATLQAFVDTEVAAIKAKTDNLPTDPADQSLVIAATDALAVLIADLQARVPAALTANGLIKADVLRIGGDDSTVWKE